MLFVSVLAHADKRKIPNICPTSPGQCSAQLMVHTDAARAQLVWVTALCASHPPSFSSSLLTSASLLSQLTPVSLAKQAGSFHWNSTREKLGCGREDVYVLIGACVTSAAINPHMQHCPLVKESDYFGTFQPRSGV